MQIVPYLGHNIRRWQVGSSTFLAWPEAGARLMHWHLVRGDGSIREVIHWPGLTDLNATPFAKARGGNPILFPFNGRVFDQDEIHFWRDLKGVRRVMPMHGFARDSQFKVTHIDDSGFIATLVPSDELQAYYPYDYEFTVTYRFHARRVTCEFSLQNLGPEPMPWSAGHHFYFAAPWTENQTRDDYVILLPDGETSRQSAIGNLMPGPMLPRRCVLSNPELVDTIHTALAGNTLRFGPKDGAERIDVSLGTEKRPPADACFVTWTAAPDAPYYCVEPWMGPPNAPGHGRGLHKVLPGMTGRFTVEVAIG